VVARSGSSTRRWWFSHAPFRAARSDLLLEPNQALRQAVMLSRRHNDLVQAIQQSLVVSVRVIISLCASYGLSPDSSYPHSFQSAAITVSSTWIEGAVVPIAPQPRSCRIHQSWDARTPNCVRMRSQRVCLISVCRGTGACLPFLGFA
jgi:hypothetical protein